MPALKDKVEHNGRPWWVGQVPEAEWDEIDKGFALERSPEGLIYFARNVLGMSYFSDPDSGEEILTVKWPDGVERPAGLWPHGEFLQMADSFTTTKSRKSLLMATRGSLKTSLLQADIAQIVIGDRDARVLVHMETYANAERMIVTLKDQFEQNQVLRHLFGDLKSKAKWAKDGLILAGRTKTNLRDPSISGSGTDKVVTGGHYSDIRVDDPTSWQQAESAEQLEKANKAMVQISPLLDPGGTIRVTMTPYAEGDVGSEIVRRQSDRYDIKRIPCGMVAVSATKLEGTPVFPHLPKKVLEEKHAEMGTQDFQAQYAMELQNPADQIFFANEFKTARWEDRFSRCNAYILVDNALSDSPKACMTAMLGVIIDWDDTVYIFDADVGQWTADVLLERLLSFYAKWQSKTRICGTCYEKVTAAFALSAWTRKEATRRGIDLRVIEVAVPREENGKRQRIRALTSRFRSGRIVVLDTMRQYYDDQIRGRQLLWNASGGFDSEGNPVPSGELVDQFTKFRNSARGKTGATMDIPDALTMVDAQSGGAHGKPYCVRTPKKYATRQAGDDDTAPPPPIQQRGRNNHFTKRRRPPGGDDFYDRIRRRTG